MAILQLTIASGRPQSQLDKLQTPTGKHSAAQKVINYLDSLQTGTELAMSATQPPTMYIEVYENKGLATGTFTLTGVTATDAVSINGVVFTAVASGATGNQFNVGVSDTATATNLKNAINGSASTLVNQYLSTTSNTNVVTIVPAQRGIDGNLITISSAVGTIVASGARLTGGTGDSSALALTF